MDRRRLHVCLISEEYPPETGWGGIGTYTYNLARGLVFQGHRVSVIAGALGPARTQQEGGATVYRIGFTRPRDILKKIKYKTFQAATIGMPYLRRKLEFARAAAGKVRQIHVLEPIDLIETAEYDANGFFVARSGTLPLVVKIHTPLMLNYQLNQLPISREVRWCDRIEKAQARRARLLTTPSRKMAELAALWLGRGTAPRVVPNPIDTAEFSPDGPRRPDPGYFFYTGRLERRKGVHLLLAAFQQVAQRFPATRLVLAGHDTLTFLDGGRGVFFKEYAESQGLLEGVRERVVFLGRVDRRELPEWYRSSLACVFPSERFENFPYSCLEAMACGKAVVVTDSGGMAEMIEDSRSGICVPAGSVDALAEAMARLAGSPELGPAMGAEARRRVLACYSLERITQMTLDVYHEVLAR